MSRLTSSNIRFRSAIAAVALVMALAGTTARAQPDSAKDAASTKLKNASGVVVHAPPTRQPPLAPPPDKAAAFALDASKDDAWRKYRDTVPSVTDGTLDQAKAFPGLRAYVPD